MSIDPFERVQLGRASIDVSRIGLGMAEAMAAAGAVAGDLASSFLKRRLRLQPGADAPGLDERFAARETANALSGIRLHETIAGMSITEMVPKLAWHLDQPFADSSAAPTWPKSSRPRATHGWNGAVSASWTWKSGPEMNTTPATELAARWADSLRTAEYPVAPAWLENLRENATAAFAEAGLPHRKVEAWRYTPLKRLEALAPGLAAVANARQHDEAIGLQESDFVVSEIRVDEGPTQKRIRARAQGRAFRIRKRSAQYFQVGNRGQLRPQHFPATVEVLEVRPGKIPAGVAVTFT